MSPLPTGTVTFPFTDIEGFTRLLQLGERHAGVLSEDKNAVRICHRIATGRHRTGP